MNGHPNPLRWWLRAGTAALVATGLLVAQPTLATAAGPRSGVAAISWGSCPADALSGVPASEQARFSCADYAVPLDYTRPSGATVSLALMRRAADDPAHRIGSLFLNPCGPGGSGYTMPVAGAHLLPAVAQRFDLIGFDPRGVGRSTQVRCFTTDEDATAVFNEIVDVPVTGPDIRSTLRGNRQYTDACAANAGPLLAQVSTVDVVRDLDRMRQAVGDGALNYLGFSYGTLIGATYANLYPQRVRALVLDGNVDPALRTTDGLEYLRERAIGQEDVLDAFLARCAEVGGGCAFAGGDPAAKFAEIRTRLRQGPVSVPALDTTVTLSQFTGFVARELYSADHYAQLATVLQTLYSAIHPGAVAPRAAVGNAWAAGASSTLGLRDLWPDTPYTGNDSSMSVNCADEPFPRVPALYPLAADVWELRAPTVGRSHAFSQLACATWPVADPPRYAGPWNRRTASTVLLFGNYHDPATNYRFDQRMAAELGNDRLVSVDAFGHTILGGKSTCADTAATRYLLDGTLPPVGTVCQPDHQPFD